MSAMGVKHKKFNVPVCNSFQAKILYDQLCYEVDLNKFTSKDNIEGQLKLGFNFIMNYNEDKKIARLIGNSVESVIHTRDISKVNKNVAALFS